MASFLPKYLRDGFKNAFAGATGSLYLFYKTLGASSLPAVTCNRSAFVLDCALDNVRSVDFCVRVFCVCRLWLSACMYLYLYVCILACVHYVRIYVMYHNNV